MSAGQGKGAGCRLPFPSTLHEAFRSSLLLWAGERPEGKCEEGRPRHAPKRGTWHDQAWPKQDRRLIATRAFRSLRIAGPLPVVERDREGSPLVWKQRRFGKETGVKVTYAGLLLPVPLDVAFETVERCETGPDGTECRWPERIALHRLRLRRNASVPARQASIAPSAYRPLCLPVAVTAPDKHGQLSGWWTVEQTRGCLVVGADGMARENNDDEFFRPLPTEDLWKAEHRIGVQISPDSFAAESGQLYAGSYLRPHAHTRLALQIGLQDPVNGEQEKLDRMEWLLLGGERRLARIWSPINLQSLRESDPFAALPSAPEPRSDGPCLLKWVLATPAIFAHGSLPGWCWNGTDRLPPGQVRLGASKRKSDTGALPGRAQLVSWCLGKPLTVSGWDVAEQCAKPTLLAVPAGSVYYFLCESRATAAALAKKLHWQPRSDFYGEKGCGYGLVSFDAQMHRTSPDIRALASELFNP